MDTDANDLVICRCEEVTEAEILDALQKGAHTLWQIRRLTRCGMGLCQGRSCERLAARLIAQFLGVSIEAVLQPRPRPPVRPVTIETLASGERIRLD